MKKAVIATLLSGAIAAPAFAASESNLADADKVFNMDNAQTMELAALSSEEMESTEGAWAPLIAVGVRAGYGALGGSVGYAVSNYGTSNFSWGGLAQNAAAGAVGGVVGWNGFSSATLGAGSSAAFNRWVW